VKHAEGATYVQQGGHHFGIGPDFMYGIIFIKYEDLNKK